MKSPSSPQKHNEIPMKSLQAMYGAAKSPLAAPSWPEARGFVEKLPSTPGWLYEYMYIYIYINISIYIHITQYPSNGWLLLNSPADLHGKQEQTYNNQHLVGGFNPSEKY